MTNQILDVAGFEENKMPVESELFDLAELMDETTEMYSGELGQVGGTMATVFDRPINISADRHLVQRILQNLLANSLKFTKPGRPPHIILHAARERDNVIFSITDNGPGIASKFHKDVFSRFFRVENGDAAPVKGLGIGLTFCKLAAEAMNGHISLDSQKDHGATFTITLPAAD